MRALALVPLLICGCAHLAKIDRAQTIDSVDGQFTVQFSDVDASSAMQVEVAIERAAPRLALWGTLSTPVTVIVEPTHADLEAAVDRRGYDWLRAWARFQNVWVQSPSTWGVWGSSQEQVDELLLHELTHCAMYQLAANADDWQRKGIPLWFREGMASYTAKQGYRRGTLEQLWNYERSHREDPIADAEALYQREPDVVYGAAHMAFTFLIERYGVDAVKRVLAEMHGGQRFDTAFARGIGIGRRDFERDFTTYVRLRGWSGKPT